MGYNTYTTDDLVSNILLIGHVPTGNNTFTTANLIRLADRELQTPIIKQILDTRGGYYKTYSDYTLAASGLYVIPSEAVAGALDNIELVQGTTIIPVNPIEESEQFSTISPNATSYAYFMKGNYVQILPTPNIGTPRLWFFKRPSTLIATTAASQITAITGNVISVASIPSTIIVGRYLDALGDQPPFNIINENLLITDITGTDITVDATPESTLVVGDWLALHSQTPVPQIPVEFRPLLEQRVIVKIYEIQGYLDKMEKAKESLKELEAAGLSLITKRVGSKTKIIMASNGGFLGGGGLRVTNFPAGKDS